MFKIIPSVPRPPQTIISLPVQIAVPFPTGAFWSQVATQLSVVGLYRPPLKYEVPLLPPPPQMIISLPVQTAK